MTGAAATAADVVREAESTCLGAGMLAAAAVGVHDSITAAGSAMSGTSSHFEPNLECAATYDELYEVYRDIYPSLRPLFARLSAVSAR